MHRIHALILMSLVASVAAADAQASGNTPAPEKKIGIAASVAPLAYFAERVGGDRVSVDVLVGPGQSPHSFEPTPKQIERLADARLFLRVGIAFENGLVPRIEKNFKNVRIVDLREGVELRKMTSAEATAHHHPGDHSHGCVHEAGEADPHSWLSPIAAKTQAAAIATALSEIDPDGASVYRKNLEAFQAELDRVHEEIATALAPFKGREVFVYHPAFGYFLDLYGLAQRPVEIDGKEPTAKQLAALIDRAKETGVKIIFVQPQFPTRSAEAVARAIDGAVVPMDDLAHDYVANLREMARKLHEKFKAS